MRFNAIRAFAFLLALTSTVVAFAGERVETKSGAVEGTTEQDGICVFKGRERMTVNEDSVDAFIKAACVPIDSSHACGTLDEAQAILASEPEVAGHDVFTAAVL